MSRTLASLRNPTKGVMPTPTTSTVSLMKKTVSVDGPILLVLWIRMT